MRNDLTYIAVVLDRSGSMESCKQPTIDGFNEFLATQKLQPGEARLYLAQFDHEYQLLYDKPLRDAEKLTEFTYVPRGMTALYDAMGTTIKTLGQKLDNIPEPDRPGKVLVAIITDGHENHSTEYFQWQVAEMVAEQRKKYSWKFAFIGANQDAILTAGKLNIPSTGAITYTANNVTGVMGQSMSNYASALRCSGTAGSAVMSFSEEERKQAVQS